MVVQSGSGPQQLEACSKILGDQVDIVVIFHYTFVRFGKEEDVLSKTYRTANHIVMSLWCRQGDLQRNQPCHGWSSRLRLVTRTSGKKNNHTGLDYVGFQPEQGFVFDQENQSENYGSAQSSFIWRHWDRLGNYQNTRRYGAACKFCMHRVEDGRIPRLEQHTLECTRVPDDTKTEL